MTVLNSRSDGMLSLALCELPFIAKNMRDSEKKSNVSASWSEGAKK